MIRTTLPPDTFAASSLTQWEFSPTAADGATNLLTAPADALFLGLLRNQESEPALLAARCVLAAFLEGERQSAEPPIAVSADAIAEQVAAVRTRITTNIDAFASAEPQARTAVLRQRAPLALLSGCWLDNVSQPATQPALIVNRLFVHHFALRGQGVPARSLPHTRRRMLESHGIYLPNIAATDLSQQTGMRRLTALHAAFYLALSRFPASFLPEVVGVHYVFFALGVDDRLLHTEPALDESELRAVLTEYLHLTEGHEDGAMLRQRVLSAVRLVLTLEIEHVEMLGELAARQAGLSLEGRVAEIVERHARYAGRQHGRVRLGDQLLSDVLDDPDFDLATFVSELRGSRHFQPLRAGGCRFLRAIKFGGPMFGVFDESEAAVFKAWAAAIEAGEPAGQLTPNHVGDDRAALWTQRLRGARTDATVLTEPVVPNDRVLFYRLVNIEHFANTLSQARQRAERGLDAAEVLFEHGAGGRYTDASWFDYHPDALRDRVDRIYWQKLVEPFRPLTEIPDREAVVFGQKVFGLGSLIDGTWAYRIGNLGRYERPSDGMLFSIYADEMGRGDLEKNHITLIHRVLRSMSIELPHIRDEAFLDQDELPDHLYGFAVHQICLALFPDSLYEEILGYNLGIEMFGLGEMRLQEMQKLRRHGFDVGYEEAHLSIDNYSAGHARQSIELIVSYLDDVERQLGTVVRDQQWRRIWRGYASFAYFVEHELVERQPAQLAPSLPTNDTDLLI